VAAALVEDAPMEDLLAAIAHGLGWHYGGAWMPQGGAVRCTATWATPEAEAFASAPRKLVLAVGEGPPGRGDERGHPAWIADVETDPNFPRGAIALETGLRSAFAFPLAGGGALEFLTTNSSEPDADLIATLTSLGRRIGHWMGHRESEARKHAMLD